MTDPLCTCGHPLSQHNRDPGVDTLTGETVQHCFEYHWEDHGDDAVGLVKCSCRRFQPAAEGRKEEQRLAMVHTKESRPTARSKPYSGASRRQRETRA